VPLIAATPFASLQRIVAGTANSAFKDDATCPTPAGEVRAINAISATFYR
jgi:beta-mannosidase